VGCGEPAVAGVLTALSVSTKQPPAKDPGLFHVTHLCLLETLGRVDLEHAQTRKGEEGIIGP